MPNIVQSHMPLIVFGKHAGHSEGGRPPGDGLLKICVIGIRFGLRLQPQDGIVTYLADFHLLA